jgi:hypothetical protein
MGNGREPRLSPRQNHYERHFDSGGFDGGRVFRDDVVSKVYRQWIIERDEAGMPQRMIWAGDFPEIPKPRCSFSFKTRAGETHRCQLFEKHSGVHQFEAIIARGEQ